MAYGMKDITSLEETARKARERYGVRERYIYGGLDGSLGNYFSEVRDMIYSTEAGNVVKWIDRGLALFGLLSESYKLDPSILKVWGVTDEIDVKASLNGFRISRGGMPETRLAQIGNQIYAEHLKYNALLSSYKYEQEGTSAITITPNIRKHVGNNLDNGGGTLFSLKDVMRVYDGEMRNTEEYSREDVNEEILANYMKSAVNVLKSTEDSMLKLYQDDSGTTAHYKSSTPYFDIDNIYTGPNDDRGHTVIGEDGGTTAWREKIGDSYRTPISHYEYGESDNTDGYVGDGSEAESFVDYDNYTSDERFEGSSNCLLKKTADMFRKHRISTMVNRYKLTEDENGERIESSAIDTTVDPTYGKAHGRSLRKADEVTERLNDVINPWCRSWTWHHQYNTYRNLIRPFIEDGDRKTDDNQGSFISKTDIHAQVKEHRAFSNNANLDGVTYLAKNSVLQDNGMVKITPVANAKNVLAMDEIKRNMLSIENLAWKDFGNTKNISRSQMGPCGGRIMWFPPYDLEFSENVSVNWQSNSFIGRGEKVYTYTDTDRTAQLSFTLLIDHPVIMDSITYDNRYAHVSDDDILRYFAGCGLMPDVEPKKEEPKEEEENKSNGSPKETAPLTSEGTLPNTIMVPLFFPNNYSGNMIISGYSSDRRAIENAQQTRKANGRSDKDVVAYMFSGCSIDSTGGNGYEMNSVSGVSEGGKNYINASRGNEGQWTCTATDQFLNDGDYTGGDKGERHFQYRVDYDLRQNRLKIGEDSSYIDSKSFKLNYDPNVAEQAIKTHLSITTESVYSFTELINAVRNNIPEGDNKERLTKLRDILTNRERKVKISVKGCATDQDSSNTAALAQRRAQCFASVLKEESQIARKGLKVETDGIQKVKNIGNSNTINSEEAKTQRCAIAYIQYDGEKITPDKYVNKEETETKKSEQAATITEGTVTSTRYDNEYRFFNHLEEDNPLVFKKIKEKFKYFDPAFHSMSPEGFNARLNFLHQCTRQGHTLSSSEAGNSGGAKTARNLAFGRMPVCVLRIGDFIYSRVMIQSMQIQYSSNGMTWDLNPEGIGVQPMYAKVSLGLVMIGGNSLDGPVSRLQNAQTFDYYANTGVYDDRADRITIDSNGKIQKYDYLFDPSRNNNQ